MVYKSILSAFSSSPGSVTRLYAFTIISVGISTACNTPQSPSGALQVGNKSPFISEGKDPWEENEKKAYITALEELIDLKKEQDIVIPANRKACEILHHRKTKWPNGVGEKPKYNYKPNALFTLTCYKQVSELLKIIRLQSVSLDINHIKDDLLKNNLIRLYIGEGKNAVALIPTGVTAEHKSLVWGLSKQDLASHNLSPESTIDEATLQVILPGFKTPSMLNIDINHIKNLNHIKNNLKKLSEGWVVNKVKLEIRNTSIPCYVVVHPVELQENIFHFFDEDL